MLAAPKLKVGDIQGWANRSAVEMETQRDQRKSAVRQRMCSLPPNSLLWTETQELGSDGSVSRARVPPNLQSEALPWDRRSIFHIGLLRLYILIKGYMEL